MEFTPVMEKLNFQQSLFQSRVFVQYQKRLTFDPCFINLFICCCFFVVVQYVVMTHIVNPGHFYVRYLAEHKLGQKLTKKISEFCSGESSFFTFSDEITTGLCTLSLDFNS